MACNRYEKTTHPIDYIDFLRDKYGCTWPLKMTEEEDNVLQSLLLPEKENGECDRASIQ